MDIANTTFGADTILKIQDKQNDNKIEVYDLQGKLITSRKIHSNDMTYILNVSEYNNGTYILKTGEKENQLIKKFVVAK